MMDQQGGEFRLSKHGIKEIGHEYNDRITDDAVLRVMMEEEERIKKIFRLSQVIARQAGRKTIKEQDVRTVYQIEDEL